MVDTNKEGKNQEMGSQTTEEKADQKEEKMESEEEEHKEGDMKVDVAFATGRQADITSLIWHKYYDVRRHLPSDDHRIKEIDDEIALLCWEDLLWVHHKHDMEVLFTNESLPPTSSSEENYKELNFAEQWRMQIIYLIGKKLAMLQTRSGKHQTIMGSVEEINRLVCEKLHWERQIAELGGPHYAMFRPQFGWLHLPQVEMKYKNPYDFEPYPDRDFCDDEVEKIVEKNAGESKRKQ